MLGFGESESEVIQAMKDLRQSNVDFLALGQYLGPGVQHAKVAEYVAPKKFDEFRKIAQDLGFLYVASGPFVRSSYKAQEAYIEAMARHKEH